MRLEEGYIDCLSQDESKFENLFQATIWLFNLFDWFAIVYGQKANAEGIIE